MDSPTVQRLLALIIEDDVAIQQLIGTLLRRHGVEAEIAGDGETALNRLRVRDYDAILLDLMLPRTNGFEVIRHLKNVSPDILKRVIVVTAASQHTLQFFEPADVRKVLRKPFDVDELIAEVLACGAEPALRRATATPTENEHPL